jgi:hypothetical protein
MEEPALALIIEKCLDAVKQGGEPDAVADRYPALKPDILPLLRVAAQLRDGASDDSIQPSAAFLQALGEQLRLRPDGSAPA